MVNPRAPGPSQGGHFRLSNFIVRDAEVTALLFNDSGQRFLIQKIQKIT